MGALGRPRRSCLAVPGSSVKMLGKAQGLPADQVFLDLEDAVAPLAKPEARKNIVAALNDGDWAGKTRVVRVNDLTTPWTYRDVIEVVEGAGRQPRRDHAAQGAERRPGAVARPHADPDREDDRPAAGRHRHRGPDRERPPAWSTWTRSPAASPRVETIIFGPADFMASINMKSLVVGALIPDYPGDPYHYILMRILMAARMHDLQAIDGPFLQIRDVDAFTRGGQAQSAALGFDGKWVLHPGQIDAANEVYAPSQSDYDHAELILDAYEYYTSEAGGKLGAVMLGDEMIDEASRKMALVIAARAGRPG